jgi:hypothetical protein
MHTGKNDRAADALKYTAVPTSHRVSESQLKSGLAKMLKVPP